MMDWTDRHCRAFHRTLTSRSWLYSEMVTTGAVLHGDVKRLLDFDAAEHPVALQLGGSDPADLAAAARIGEGFGYDEINLNVGCPSDRVQSGRFGACLMREPALVADCVAAMRAAVQVPVTVKCRLGVDDQDPEDSLFTLVDTCAMAVELGATFVGRSFSGDKKQLLAMLKAAIAHRGTVMLDVISPCVTFNDHEGSTKSYKYVQEHEEAVNEIGFVPSFEDISVDYDPGSTYDVEMHDGSHLRLRKIHPDYNPTSRIGAVTALMQAHEQHEVLTGVFYVDTTKPSFTDMLNMVDEPLASLPESRVRPSRQVLEQIMQKHQ